MDINTLKEEINEEIVKIDVRIDKIEDESFDGRKFLHYILETHETNTRNKFDNLENRMVAIDEKIDNLQRELSSVKELSTAMKDLKNEIIFKNFND